MQTIYITSNYRWDQNKNDIILYIYIPNADQILKENYDLRVDPRRIQLAIEDHEGINYDFKVSNLCGELDPKGTTIKFKPKKVIICLRKKEIGKQWNDIKAKSIRDVYSQMQRQMDTNQRTAVKAKDEEELVNGYGRQDKACVHSPTQTEHRCTLDPFHITDIITPAHHHNHKP